MYASAEQSAAMSIPAAGASERPTDRYERLLRRLIASHQWEKALETARQWLDEDPAEPRAHLAAGQSLCELRQPQPACQHLLEALKGNPRSDRAHRLLARARFAQRDYRQADQHLAQAIALNPADAYGWYYLAWMRESFGATELAARHGRHALSLDPENVAVLNLLARCQDPRSPEQLAQSLRVLELAPDNASAHRSVGNYRLNVDGNYPAAEESFRRALHFEPTDKAAQRGLFLTLRRRDTLYRALQFPLILAERLRLFDVRGGVLGKLAFVLAGFVAGKFLLGGLAVWALFVFPLAKVYEYLTLGDIRARAGVPGARRGGAFGLRAWPLKLRFGLFAVLVAAFWGGLAFLGLRSERLPLFGAAIGVIGLGMYFQGMGMKVLIHSARVSAAKRSEKRFQKYLRAAMP